MQIKSSNEHITNILIIIERNNISALDAVTHYTEKHGYDAYFIADVVKSNRAFYTQLQKEARDLNILK